MTRINQQVAARDVKVGDRIDSYPTQGISEVWKQGIVSFTYSRNGVVHLWLEGTPADRASDIRLNHGDPCRIGRERVETPSTSRWQVIGPDDASLVDVYDGAEALALRGVTRDEIIDLCHQLIKTLKGV
jgi:hypothetical protein